MKINRVIASNVLTDNFCLLYGEKFRELFESVGEKLIDLGIKNAKVHFNEYVLKNSLNTHLSTMIKFFKPNKYYTSLDEMKSTILKELKPFLNEEDILKLFEPREYSSYNKQNFAEPKGFGRLQSNIIDELGNSKPTPTKKLNFDYFKQFKIYSRSNSITLVSESGLGLDQFSYKEVKYYLDENEEFYLAEAIANKYHAIGSIIGREELRIDMSNKIKENITESSDNSVKKVVKTMLEAYCFDSELDSTLLDIQKVCGVSGLETNKQIDDSLKNMDMSGLKDLFKKDVNESKVITKFKDF